MYLISAPSTHYSCAETSSEFFYCFSHLFVWFKRNKNKKENESSTWHAEYTKKKKKKKKKKAEAKKWKTNRSRHESSIRVFDYWGKRAVVVQKHDYLLSF